MEKEPWGWLTAVDASGCDHEAIHSTDTFNAFIADMLKELDMVPIGSPQFVYCETNDPMKVGWTLYQILQDSNISVHLCSETREGYFDIFSCKPYDHSLVPALVQKHFNPTAFNWNVIERTAP